MRPNFFKQKSILEPPLFTQKDDKKRVHNKEGNKAHCKEPPAPYSADYETDFLHDAKVGF